MAADGMAVCTGGVLIAVEGGDGSGKSTQSRLLERHLRTRGWRVHRTSWNSSPGVHPIIREGKRSRHLTPTTYALIHAADFADRYEREIEPRLALGEVVLCDRYVGTAFARDGARGVDPAWTGHLYAFARPADLTLFFHAPVEVMTERLRGRPKGFSYYEAGLDLGLSDDPTESFGLFQRRVMEHYEELEDELGYVRVDARRTIREQQREVRERVNRLLSERHRVDAQ